MRFVVAIDLGKIAIDTTRHLTEAVAVLHVDQVLDRRSRAAQVPGHQTKPGRIHLSLPFRVLWRFHGSLPLAGGIRPSDRPSEVPPFLSQQEIDRRLERTHAAKIALDRIVELILGAPDAAPSRELRLFLGSLFNGYHVINLWTLRHALDRQQSGWATEVFTAWMGGHVSDELLRRALTDSGEMGRLNSAHTHLSSADQQRLHDAVDGVTELLRTISPGSSHAVLTRALALLHEAVDQRAQ